MSAQPNFEASNYLLMRSCIQKVATGPEYSKDLSFEEAYGAMRHILSGEADPVQSAVFLIALRMKRETDDENGGTLQAIRDAMITTTAPVDDLLDIADPYDGHTRGLTVAPFLPAVFAACGQPAVSHGLEAVGPKYGITHRKVLRAADVNVDLTCQQAADQIGNSDTGWAYIDQRAFCPALHDLTKLRTRIIKRPVITTVEVLTGPIRGKSRTHLMTGFVHKAYPPIYTHLAKLAGFETAAIIRGVEGGVIPSISQPSRIFHYSGDEAEQRWDIDPHDIGIEQKNRAIPLPENLPPAKQSSDAIGTEFDIDVAAQLSAEAGLEALEGKAGLARDSLVYAGAIMLTHLKKFSTMQDAAERVRNVLDSGEALKCLRAAA